MITAVGATHLDEPGDECTLRCLRRLASRAQRLGLGVPAQGIENLDADGIERFGVGRQIEADQGVAGAPGFEQREGLSGVGFGTVGVEGERIRECVEGDGITAFTEFVEPALEMVFDGL